MTPEKEFFIKCEKCGETVVQADTLQKLFEQFFKKATYNNHGIENLCEDAKDELSLDDLRGSFAGEYYQVYQATEHEEKPVEWQKAGYGGLKN